MTDPIVIKPTAAPLTDAISTPNAVDSTAAPASDNPSRKLFIPIAAVVALSLLYGVFFVLPGMVAPNVAPNSNELVENTTGDSTQPPPPSANSSEAAKAVTPFRDAQLARAKQQAEEELATFVELQIELEETLQIASWGQTSYDAVKDKATLGDTQFVERDFEAALTTYRDATTALEALRDRGEADYASAIQAGEAAINDFNQLLAEREFNKALGFKENDVAATAGLARAANLPEIQSLLRKARQLARRGDTQAATSAYNQVLSIDPLTPTVTEALAQLSEAATNADFQDQLSRGFSELERARYSSARTAFNAALAIKPGNAVAQGGLQQIAQETEVRGLRELSQVARQAIADENWKEAVAACEKALAIDENLEFALAGRREALERLRLARGMGIIITQPQNLSDNKRMAQAKDLLATVAGMSSAGPKWDAAMTAANSLIESYSQPVAVRLTSDNATEVTVYKVGRLGAFTTHDLSLRPGAYTIVGTANRCQDIRREVIVKPQMAAIDIRCENRL